MCGHLARTPEQQHTLARILLQDGCDNLFLQYVLDENMPGFQHVDGADPFKVMALKMVTNVGQRFVRNSMSNFLLLTAFPTRKAEFEINESCQPFEDEEDMVTAQMYDGPLPNPSYYRKGHAPVILTLVASARSPSGTRIPTPIRQTTPITQLDPNMVQCLTTDAMERCNAVQRAVDANPTCPSNVIHHAFWVPLGEWVLVMPPEAVGNATNISSPEEMAILNEIKYDTMIGHLQARVYSEDAFVARMKRKVIKSRITAKQANLQEKTRQQIVSMYQSFQSVLEERIVAQFGEKEVVHADKREEIRTELEGLLQKEIDAKIVQLKDAQATMVEQYKEQRRIRRQQHKKDNDDDNNTMVDTAMSSSDNNNTEMSMAPPPSPPPSLLPPPSEGMDTEKEGGNDKEEEEEEGGENEDDEDDDYEYDNGIIEHRNVPRLACPVITEITENGNIPDFGTGENEYNLAPTSHHAIRLKTDFDIVRDMQQQQQQQQQQLGSSHVIPPGSLLPPLPRPPLSTTTAVAVSPMAQKQPPRLSMPVTIPAEEPTRWAVICYIPHPTAWELLSCRQMDASSVAAAGRVAQANVVSSSSTTSSSQFQTAAMAMMGETVPKTLADMNAKERFIHDQKIVGMLKVVYVTDNKQETPVVERMLCDVYNDIFEFYTIQIGNRVRMPESQHAEQAALEGKSAATIYQHPKQTDMFGSATPM